jgi:hypothetical protein
MHGRHSTASRSAVDHIVVIQRGEMNQFDRRGGEVGGGSSGRSGARGQQDEGRPKPFASCSDEMSRRVPHKRVV